MWLQVMADNVYERRSSHDTAGPHAAPNEGCGPCAMDVDSHVLGGSAGANTLAVRESGARHAASDSR